MEWIFLLRLNQYHGLALDTNCTEIFISSFIADHEPTRATRMKSPSIGVYWEESYGMRFLPTSYPRHDHNFRHVMDFYRHVTDFYRQVIIFYRQVIFLPSQLHFFTVTTSFFYRHDFIFLPSRLHFFTVTTSVFYRHSVTSVYIFSRHHVKHSKEKSSKKSQYKQE